ncbi:MAG: glycosyltransferase [Thermoanaerobaculia bacterium]|nr:glycosyltransferase [Thermoanaerobaculia bacterium]
MRVTIGLYLETEPWRLEASLASLCSDLENRSQAAAGVELLLLPDGPDREMRRALAGVSHLPSSATAEPRGMAACFNRLAGYDDADVVILLEAGCQVAPGWLEHIVAALGSSPDRGLAGPSTCRAWNEQAAFRREVGNTGRLEEAELARLAADAAQRFGSACRTLEPLHSLADFCYAVRREVIDTIGCADEGYGTGPCWEMDYNVRAARAGFQGVWVGAAYVHRPPFTERRRDREARQLDRNRRLYQDRFCALRLAGQRAGYKRHCRGDVCTHFAPRELIQIHRTSAMTEVPRIVQTSVDSDESIDTASRQPKVEARIPSQEHSVSQPLRTESPLDRPLVSCIMPTAGRPEFVLQSVRYFERQDYPNRELIVIDDTGDQELARQLAGNAAVRYLQMPGHPSIGAKRNLGISEARGDLIAHWDDDDWYAEDRLSAQIEPILAGEADITGLTAGVIFELDHWRFWRCSSSLHRRMFVGDVHGGTLVFRRQVAERVRYPDRSLAEDAFFLRRARACGARLRRLDNGGRFIYLRHGTNSWSFACGSFLDSSGWEQVSAPDLSAEDRAFYAARSSAAPRPDRSPTTPRRALATGTGGNAEPLVSCIMPTADRREFVAQAVRYFQRQSYPHRELIVFDDGEDPVEDVLVADPRIRYFRSDVRRNIGDKRNLACAEARGELIAHWDDDDWSARDRLARQVAALEERQADVCGLDRVLFYDPISRRSWRYTYPSARSWVYGATLCYRSSFWRRRPFPSLQVGEDNRFVQACLPERLLTQDDEGFFVALVHVGNTSTKRTRGSRWQEVPRHEVEQILDADLPFYRGLGTAAASRERGEVAGSCLEPGPGLVAAAG